MTQRFIWQTSLFLLWVVLSGCSAATSSVVWQTAGVDWTAPAPPEQPRIRFLRQISGLDDIRSKESGRSIFNWISGEEETQLPFLSPYGVATDGQGLIWLADPGSAVVHAIDIGRQTIEYLSAFDGRKLLSPVGVAYDGERKRLYISDSELGEVLVFDKEYRYQSSISAPEGFLRPAGVVTDRAGTLYVVDVLAGVVQTFDASGRFLEMIGSRLSETGKFNHPTNIALDSQGRLYVVDGLNFRVEIVGLEGEAPRAIGRLGSVPGTFARPRGIAIDSEGHIYVSDAAFDNVQIFDRSGTLLLVFGSSEKGPGQFCMPAGMTFDDHDRLYVADSCGYRVKVFKYLNQKQ